MVLSGEGEVIKPLGDADIVEDKLAFRLRDGTANVVLDLLEILLRVFDACAGGSAHMKLNKPRVDGGEEVAANIVRQHARRPEDKDADQGNDIAAGDKPIQHPHIKAAEALEAVVESALEAPEEAGIILVVPEVFRAQQNAVDDRYQRP